MREASADDAGHLGGYLLAGQAWVSPWQMVGTQRPYQMWSSTGHPVSHYDLSWMMRQYHFQYSLPEQAQELVLVKEARAKEVRVDQGKAKGCCLPVVNARRCYKASLLL